MTDGRDFRPNPDDPFPMPERPGFPYQRPIDVRWPLEPVIRLRYPPATVRILVVADGSISFGSDGFGLGTVLGALSNHTLPEHPAYVRFSFTKAHRSSADGVTAGFENFRFVDGSLAGFDEVWLFGILNAPWTADPGRTGPYLSDTELRVLSQFMEDGGGVFATGDHEDLGLGLCGGVPRVRNMRKWWFDRPPTSPLPPGELNAPHVLNLDRNDTVQPDIPGGDPNAGDQDDAVPQPVWPKWYYSSSGGSLPIRLKRYPHPTLCGPRGAIRVLPDHQHEGDCVVPSDLSQSLTFDGFTFDEYPGGHAPEVIAIGRNVVGRNKGGYVISEARPFGLLSAYDGHRVATYARPSGVGRVFCDSTWHHWFNINVDALAAENGTEWLDIIMHFRNVGIWLAPKARQLQMRRAGTLIWRYVYPLAEEIPPYAITLDPDVLYHWGVSARDALGRRAPQCQSYAFVLDWARPHLSDEMARLLDPWSQDERRLEQLEDPAYAQLADEVICGLYGGIVASIAVNLPEAHLMSEEEIDGRLDDVVAEGVRMGMDAAMQRIGRYAKGLGSASQMFGDQKGETATQH